MDDVIYPAPKVKWYQAAQEHPSIKFGANPIGFDLPRFEAPGGSEDRSAKNTAAGSKKPGVAGNLTVELEEAVLASAGEGSSYSVSAYYPGEPQATIDVRRTEPCSGHASAHCPGKLICRLGKAVSMPYNSRQQFVKVAVFNVSVAGDSLVGEVSIPLADPKAESMAVWTILKDFEEQGEIALRIRPPGEGDDALDSNGAIAAAPGSTTSTDLILHVQRASGLLRSAGEASYCVTAYYPSEPPETVESRRTQPDKTFPSDDSCEECLFNKHIRIPFNSKQQFVKVSVYKVDVLGDSLIGTVTAPLADERMEKMTDWPLVRDFEDYGRLTFCLLHSSSDARPPEQQLADTKTSGQLPQSGYCTTSTLDGSDSGHKPPPSTQASSLPSGGPSLASAESSCPFAIGAGSPVGAPCVRKPLEDPGSGQSLMSDYRVGDVVEVFSKSAGSWLRGTVTHIEGTSVTVDYGERRRIVDLESTPTFGDQLPLRRLSSDSLLGELGDDRHMEKAKGRPTFTKGQRCEVWSSSRRAWLDGIVEEVFEEPKFAEGYHVPAGSYKVKSSAGVKWILPGERERDVRPKPK